VRIFPSTRRDRSISSGRKGFYENSGEGGIETAVAEQDAMGPADGYAACPRRM